VTLWLLALVAVPLTVSTVVAFLLGRFFASSEIDPESPLES
jgi:hypothetical protein